LRNEHRAHVGENSSAIPQERADAFKEASPTDCQEHRAFWLLYALARWSALCRFLDDGRIDTVERAIRPIALGRKNHLFAGSDGGAARWATVASLLATAKLNGVEPFAYLKDVLERLSNGHPMSQLDDLLPWNWARSSATD